MKSPSLEERNSHLNEQQKARFRLWLQRQFEKRTQKNPRYSLRAFASLLQSDPSSISQLLSGKRFPSRNAMLKICQKLAASPRDLKMLGMVNEQPEEKFEAYQLSMDAFAAISDWYHYAILEMTSISSFSSDPARIGSQLGISATECKAAIERLLRLGLLKEEAGRLTKTHKLVTNHVGLGTSAARKALQRQVISKALKAVDDVPQEEKDITSMTMAIDPKNLDQARALISNFRRQLCEILEDGEPSQVFQLGIQLYPVSKRMSSAATHSHMTLARDKDFLQLEK